MPSRSSHTDVTAVVLAAGLGTRMKSQKPKVLHIIAGRTLLGHVVSGLGDAGVSHFRVVVGHGADQVRENHKDISGISFFDQKEQRGTADAVKSAQPDSLQGTVLICNGDHPLITGADYAYALE